MFLVQNLDKWLCPKWRKICTTIDCMGLYRRRYAHIWIYFYSNIFGTEKPVFPFLSILFFLSFFGSFQCNFLCQLNAGLTLLQAQLEFQILDNVIIIIISPFHNGYFSNLETISRAIKTVISEKLFAWSIFYASRSFRHFFLHKYLKL